MAGEVTQELIYEILKSLQEGQHRLEAQMREMNAQLMAVRTHMQAMQADIGNLYTLAHRLDLRLERVERRLGLTELV